MNKLFVGLTKTIEPTRGLFIHDDVLDIPRARIFDPTKHSFNPLKDIDYKKARALAEVLYTAYPRRFEPLEEAVLGTPFHWQSIERHYEYRAPFVIPKHLRFGHQFLVGASRSGKTTFLTAQLLEDLKRAERGECSIIVMDSQNEFVPNISKLALFGRGQPLEGKLIYLEPQTYPIASNIFSGDFRANYDNAEFFLNSVFKDTFSPQQTTVLKYAIQALSVIPDATLSTLMDLTADGGYEHFRHRFDTLDPVVHKWLKERLYSKDFIADVLATSSISTLAVTSGFASYGVLKALGGLQGLVAGYANGLNDIFLVIESTDIAAFIAAQVSTGFNMADMALKNGFMGNYLGVDIYVVRSGVSTANHRLAGIKKRFTVALPTQWKFEEKGVSGKTGKEVVLYGYYGSKVWHNNLALIVDVQIA